MTATQLTLDSPVADIDPRVAGRTMGRKGGRPAHGVLADQFGIETVGQLLRHYPRRYIDRSNTVPIRAIRTVKATQPTLAVAGSEADRRRIAIGQWVTVIATVDGTRQRWTRNRQQMVTVTVDDGTGNLELPFFNQPWIANQFRAGRGGRRLGPGRQCTAGPLQLQQQEVEILRGDDADTVHTGRIIPVHRATEGITTRTIRELVYRGAPAAAGRSPSRCPPTSWPARSLSTRTRRCAGSTSRPRPRQRGRAHRPAEVRRAVHARARRRVPQAPPRAPRGRGRARPGRAARRAFVRRCRSR